MGQMPCLKDVRRMCSSADTPSFTGIPKSAMALDQRCAESSDGAFLPQSGVWGSAFKMTAIHAGWEIMGVTTALNPSSQPPLQRCSLPPTQPLPLRPKPGPEPLQTQRSGLAEIFRGNIPRTRICFVAGPFPACSSGEAGTKSRYYLAWKTGLGRGIPEAWENSLACVPLTGNASLCQLGWATGGPAMGCECILEDINAEICGLRRKPNALRNVGGSNPAG